MVEITSDSASEFLNKAIPQAMKERHSATIDMGDFFMSFIAEL